MLHAAYFSYYFIVLLPALYFAWAGRRGRGPPLRPGGDDHVRALLSGLHLLPGRRALLQVSPPPAWFTDNAPARLVYDTLAQGSSYGAAFPSSHVAATVAAALAAGRDPDGWGSPARAHGAATIGVVYCQMHYGVDALAGLVMGAVADRGADRAMSDAEPRRWAGNNREGPEQRAPHGALDRAATTAP